jgi:hypothetical protein
MPLSCIDILLSSFFMGEIKFISTKFIALMSYFGNRAFVAPIITIRFLSNHHSFYLEVICDILVYSSSKAHLRMA